MQDLQLFEPFISEFQTLSQESKLVTIRDFNDIIGYEDTKRMISKLTKARTNLVKTAKEVRDEALQFQKAVIQKEKELLSITEKEEERLKKERESFENNLEMQKRKKLLPERFEKLSKINFVITEEDLLLMSDIEFERFLNQKTSEYLEEQNRKIENEKKIIADEKAKREKEVLDIQVEKERLQKEKEDFERKQKEREKWLENDFKEKAEKQRKDFEEEQKLKEENEEKARKEKEKNDVYKEFLIKNSWKSNDINFNIVIKENTYYLYKLIDSITL